VTGNKVAAVFDPEPPLDRAFGEIPELAEDAGDRG
jgi:hypothetical protein